ncbi:MAG: T9SS type A sorting domain-containing protein [Crocinitomicaceae bacterium]
MKKLILLWVFLFLKFMGVSQVWQTLPINYYSAITYLGWDYGDVLTSHRQHFKINPFDNSVWGVSHANVIRLDDAGNFEIWNHSNAATLPDAYRYTDINFIGGNTFLVSKEFGLFQFDGLNWGLLSGLDNGYFLSTDLDTLWMSRSSGNFISYYSGNIYPSSNLGADRMISKNGYLYGSGGSFQGAFMNLTNSTPYFYDPLVDPYYLDYKNYDFKFLPNSDTLYTSGDRGFSIALHGIFIDTITKFNTINMPDLAITEFEFDALGNIWAVFSQPSATDQQPERIGYLDRSTHTWLQFYDQTNSPVAFAQRSTIELDTNGNLWVADGAELHVLEIGGNLPAWLGTNEITKEENWARIFPNPSNGELQVESNFSVKEITFFNLLGNEINRFSSNDELNLTSGVFLVEIKGEKGEIFRKKVVIH